ncbi:RNA polymerase sigma factor [Microbacterium sp. P5_E9]
MTDAVTRANVGAASTDLTNAFQREAATLLGFFIRRGVPPQDAADLVGETFLAAWKSSGRHRVEPAMLRAWLFGIARKVLSQYRRGRVRRTALTDRVRATLPSDNTAQADGSPDGLDPALAQHVRELIQYLPETDQEIVRLVYWEGFSQEEVATILGKPATTVRARLSRARTVLRQQLDASGDIE